MCMNDRDYEVKMGDPLCYSTNDAIFLNMCHAMTNLTDSPKELEAFFFCKIYTHLDCDSIVRGIKWVRAMIRGKTVHDLGDHSETIMQSRISDNLAWKEWFWEDMEEIVDAGNSVRLGDLDYCDTVPLETMNHYSDRVYGKCMAKVENMMNTPVFTQEAKLYVSANPLYQKYFKGVNNDDTSRHQ